MQRSQARDFEVFQGKRPPDPVVEEPIHDRWGTWSSASVYVKDESGRPVAVLITEVDCKRAVSSYNETRRLWVIFSTLVFVLICLIVAQWILWRHHRQADGHCG